MPSNTFVGQPLDLSDDRAESTRRKEQYDTRANEVYDWGTKLSDKIDKRAGEVSDMALDTSKSFADYGKRDQDFYEGTYMPVMKKQVDDAMNWDSSAEMTKASGEAGARAAIVHDQSGRNADMQLRGFGIDPSAGRYAGMQASTGVEGSKLGVAAQNDARRKRALDAQSLRANAIRTGQVLPGQAVNEAGVSLAGGNASANALGMSGTIGKSLRDPSGWVKAGDDAHDDIRDSFVIQTKLGMEQNRDAAQQALAWAKLNQGQSSGLGMLAGGILGGVMNAYTGGMGGTIMNMAGGMFGGGGGGGVTNAGSMGSGIGGSYTPGDSGAGGVLGSMGGGLYSKRGGLIEKPKQAFSPNFRAGGAVEAVPKFVGGGLTSGLQQGTTGLDSIFSNWGGGGGFSAPDVKPFDVGMGQDLDVYDPASLGWGQFDKDNPEREDSKGEGTGREIGGTLGGLLGSIWGPIGKIAGREIFQKVGGAVGAGVEGKWGDVAENLVEGTPLDFAAAEGGNVASEEDEFDMPMEDDPTTGVGDSDQVVRPEMSPSGGEETDDVHAMLNEGEFVIPKEVVRWNGEKFFQKLIEKSYAEMQGPKVAEPEYGPATAVAMSPPTFNTTGA